MLNLEAFWQQEVKLTPITVEELEFIHRAPIYAALCATVDES